MATNDVPVIGSMKRNVQVSTPTVSDGTIMDDTVVTMDSSTALMGGSTTSISAQRQTIKTVVPRPIIKIRR